MNQKWNLQDIRPAGNKSRNGRTTPTHKAQKDIVPTRRKIRKRSEDEYDDQEVSSINVVDGDSKRKKRIIVSIILAVFVVGFGFFINTLLGGAELIIHPKLKDVTVEATFTGKIDPQVDELGYELLTLEAEGERQVAATGREEASELTTGSIFIYNAFSKNSMRLVKNTRFESPDGLIFKIKESAVVPGYTTADDGTIAPGIITAEVFADGTGEQYNIAASRFTIPGFAGEPEFDGLYGESTEAMTGGFEGQRFIIEETELKTAQQSLQNELRDGLLARLENEKPAGFIVYDDAVTFSYETLPATEYGAELATIKEHARLQIPIFKELEFATYIAKNTIAGYEGEPVKIEDPTTLTFSYPELTTITSDISQLNEIDFTLKGNALVVWVYDEAQLKSDIAGLSKTALSNVLIGYPAIDKAEAIIRPFWRQSFPDNIKEITLKRILE